ncbi:WAT1-related protein At4g30420-like [Telopea speciosissima]|uniref:WAT1-related protein At4g30420-like n=1 Tax=Telopea speciosissima TaxID=54955 RepID=UPI001CC73B87|nr:WAT1-related protein At4g30420-like [Telopea speciosissima]
MGRLEDYMPTMAMVLLQFTYAGLHLFTRAALLEGMSPKVFVVYRQAIATLVIAPVAYFSNRKKTNRSSMGLRSFSLIFIASFIGVAIYQNIFFEGLYLASPSTGSAMSNLLPGITYLMATVVGLEKLNIRSLRSMAKAVGTAVCVGGAVSMALLRGPKILNTSIFPFQDLTLSSGGGENWLMGCLLLFGSSCCWSFFLILQVPMSACYPDHLSLCAWMCFLSTLQSATLAFFLEPNPSAWNLHSISEISSCIYAGIVASAVTFSVQSWCIQKRGPLFAAMFNPLLTVIVTIFACIFLHEELFIGRLAGSFVVVVGLYIVLWGKAKDLEEINGEVGSIHDTMKTVRIKGELGPIHDTMHTVTILIDEPLRESGKLELEEPLLAHDNSSDVNNDSQRNQ